MWRGVLRLWLEVVALAHLVRGYHRSGCNSSNNGTTRRCTRPPTASAFRSCLAPSLRFRRRVSLVVVPQRACSLADWEYSVAGSSSLQAQRFALVLSVAAAFLLWREYSRRGFCGSNLAALAVAPVGV